MTRETQTGGRKEGRKKQASLQGYIIMRCAPYLRKRKRKMCVIFQSIMFHLGMHVRTYKVNQSVSYVSKREKRKNESGGSKYVMCAMFNSSTILEVT